MRPPQDLAREKAKAEEEVRRAVAKAQQDLQAKEQELRRELESARQQVQAAERRLAEREAALQKARARSLACPGE